MNNSFFGKTIEDTRRYKDIKIVTNPKHFEKLVSKPTFEHMKIYEEDMAAIELKKQTVTLDNPRYFFIIYIYIYIYNHLSQICWNVHTSIEQGSYV